MVQQSPLVEQVDMVQHPSGFAHAIAIPADVPRENVQQAVDPLRVSQGFVGHGLDGIDTHSFLQMLRELVGYMSRYPHVFFLGPFRTLQGKPTFTMRILSLLLLAPFGFGVALGQAPEIEIDLTATEVLSQGQTGTCWSFSTTSFLESEVFRISGELQDLSEMAAVRVIYPEKAERFVRYQGKHQFGPGGLCHDVIHAAAVYGLVPQSAYQRRAGARCLQSR